MRILQPKPCPMKIPNPVVLANRNCGGAPVDLQFGPRRMPMQVLWQSSLQRPSGRAIKAVARLPNITSLLRWLCEFESFLVLLSGVGLLAAPRLCKRRARRRAVGLSVRGRDADRRERPDRGVSG